MAMELLIPILLVLGLIAFVFVLPLSASISARRSARYVDELRQRVSDLERSLAEVRSSGLSAPTPPSPREAPKSAALQPPLPGPTPPPIEPRPIPPAPARPTPPPPVSIPEAVATPKPDEATLPLPPPIPPAVTATRPDRADQVRPTVNWEQFMGVKLFAWLGGLALFLAVAYFVKYSFDHNLVPPPARVAIGFLAGLSLLVGGVRLHVKPYRVTAQTLCATGAVILYAASFAGHAVYQLPWFGQIPTFLLMSLITATAFLLAVRLEALVVAVLGMLGGFLTPVLLSTGEDHAAALFSYIALLDIGLIAVACRRRWSFLVGLSALGTLCMQLLWVMQFFKVETAGVALAIFLGFAVLYLLGVLALRRDQRGADFWFAGSSAALALVAMSFCWVLMTSPELAHRPGWLATLLFGGDLCLLILAVLQPRAAGVQIIGGGVAFLVLATWTAGYMAEEHLAWGLSLYFLFGVLHSVWPLIVRRWLPDTELPVWMHLFAPLSLILVMLPLLKMTVTSLTLWVVVLLVDVLAIVLALTTASLATLLGVLVLTVVALLLWIARVPVEAFPLPTALLLTGGFAVLFWVAGWLGPRWLQRSPAGPGLQAWTDRIPWLGTGPDQLRAQIPALSAILPFTLLLLVISRVPLDNPSGVFGLALLLVVLLLTLALALGLDITPAIGLGCVLAVEHVWQARQLTATSFPGLVLGWTVLFTGVFVAFPFVFRRRFADRVIPWAVGALAAPFHFFLIHRLFKTAWPNPFMGLVPLTCALPMIACLGVIVREFPVDHARRNTVLAWFGGAALFFITLVFPIQFDREWITLGWALEGLALCWLFHRIPHPGLRWVGVGLLAVAFVRLALNPTVLGYHPRAETALFNWYLYTYGVGAAALFGAAHLLAPPRHLLLQRNVPPILRGLGTLLVFLLVNIEIADYFTQPGQPTLTFQFSGLFARDMSYTIAWALFALLLVVVGLVKRARYARYAGIALLAITLLKLFLHDLASLAQLYRIGALAGVAVVAIAASFLYQKLLAGSGNDSAPPTP